jgi:hypothetical protein
MNWLIHEPNQNTERWRNAWRACHAVHEGQLPAEDARIAVELAATGGPHRSAGVMDNPG